MPLQWSSNQPSEPGFYWAAFKDSEKFVMVQIGPDGRLLNGQAEAYDLWSWPVEVPPAPVRATVPPAQPEPAKEVTDVPPTTQA